MTPRSQEKLFKREYAHELLRIAKGDLQSAEILARSVVGRSENCAYLAQQSIEKALKAALCWLQVPVPLVHDAGILVAKLPSDMHPPGSYRLGDLTPFATIRRYEEASLELTPDELKEILGQAAAVMDWAEKLIQ